MVDLELIFPSDANAKKLATMVKKFSADYPKPTKSTGLTAKQRNQLARGDIDNDYSFWIRYHGDQVGFVTAPKVTSRKDGALVGRYLDTRYIEPQYRGLGIGSAAVDLLENHYQLTCNKLLLSKIDTPAGKWWIRRNFCMGVPCFHLDQNMQYEKYQFMSGTDQDIHWFLYKKGTEEANNLPALAVDLSK